MSNKQTTAMQMAIDEIAANIDIADNPYTRRGLRIAQTVLIKLLTKEREQIENAFDYATENWDIFHADYFTQTFKQD